MKLLILIVTTLFIGACGVKGDPLPPEKPAELGRGRPTYKRAMKNIKINAVTEDPEDEEKVDKEDNEAEE
jgi:hypothetical protein